MSLEQRYVQAIYNGDDDAADRAETELRRQQTRDDAALNKPDSLLASALWYAQQGIPVFPLQPLGKKPLPGSNGFKDATCDETQIRAWWTGNLGCNIGAPTGGRFDVVDVDGPQGIRSMYWGDQALIDTITILGKAATSRPGGQHIYIPPSGMGNKTGLYPGVDFRGTGGYVVVPPSIGANGIRYQWLTPIRVTQLAKVS